jgi:hypothetical protein
MEKFHAELGRWRGILNHEVGHAQYTLWKANPKAKKINQGKRTYPLDHHMFNDLFENGRMERVACQDYPGMIRDLQTLEGFLGEIITTMYKKDPKRFNHIYYALRMVVNGYEPVIPIPEEMRKDWEVVREMAEEAWETDDEEETYRIAQSVAAYLKKRYEEEKAKREEGKEDAEKLQEKLDALEAMKDALEAGEDMPAPDDTPSSVKMPWEEDDEDAEPQDGEGSGGEESDEEDDTSSGKGRSTSKEEGEESDEEDEDSSPSKGDHDEDAEEDGDSTGSDEGEESDEEDDGEEGEEEGTPEKADRGTGKGSHEKSEGEEKSEEEDRKDKVEQLKDEIEKTKAEIAKNIEEQLQAQKDADSLSTDTVEAVDVTDKYEEEHKDDARRDCTRYGGGQVVPLPLHDYVKNVEVVSRKHHAETKSILDECMGAVAGMAQRFIQKVRSRVHVGTRTFQGRVNRRKLHRYRTDKNIFKTESLRKKKDAAVMIIVDCSGSMMGSKIATARKAALVIGEMMQRGHVEFEIRGFTIPYYEEYSFPCFTRHSDLIHYRFGGSKDWDHTKHNVMGGDLGEHGLQDNDDGESLRHFADELSQSKKDSKMMIVISDGQPASRSQHGDGSKDLLGVIPEIRESGIDVYAIGLDTDVQKYYGADKSVRLSAHANTQQLVEAIGEFVNLITVRG